MNSRIDSWLEDVSGKWAFYLPMFYFAGPLSVLSSVVQDADPTKPLTFILWLIASLLGYLAMLAVAIFARKEIVNATDSRILRIFKYEFWCFLAGATKGLITGFIGGLLVDTSSFNNALLPRSITSGLIALLIVPAGSLFLANRERFSRSRESLIKESLRIESETLLNENTTLGMQSAASLDADSEVGSKMKSLLKIISASEKTADQQWDLIAEELRRIVNESIRPISHALWSERQSQYPELSARELIGLAIGKFLFPMWFVISASLIGATGQFLRHSDGESPFALIIWTTASIAIPYIFLRSLVNKNWMSGTMAFLVLIGTSVIIEIIQLTKNVPGISTLAIFFNATTFGIFLTATLLSGGVIYVSMQSQNEILDQLGKLVSQDRINLMASEIKNEVSNREIAKFLHGHLQTRLMSMALALELAGANNDLAKVKSTIQEIELVLDEPLLRFDVEGTKNLKEIADSIGSSWAGLAYINSYISSDCLNLSSNLIRSIGTLLTESVTNAIRHGMATEINVTVQLTNFNEIEVLVVDNGIGLEQKLPGLGTGLFNSICGSRWSLTSNHGRSGATFTATLPR